MYYTWTFYHVGHGELLHIFKDFFVLYSFLNLYEFQMKLSIV